MTFDYFETSVDDGRPIELLKITYLTNSWFYTTSDLEVIHDGNVYIPLPISRADIAPTGDVAKSSLAIKVPQDCPVGELFRIQPPSGIVTVTLFAKHVDDPQVKTLWMGRVTNAEWEEPWLILTTENVYSSLQRVGVRRKFSTQCPHALYSQGHGLCNANKDDFKVTGAVSAVSGVVISCPTAAGHVDGYFAGGKVEWVHDINGYLEQRMILGSDTDGNLTITSSPVGLVVGASINAYPGCDHSTDMCDTKFNNSENFGGTPFIPKKNPFGGSTLY